MTNSKIAWVLIYTNEYSDELHCRVLYKTNRLCEYFDAPPKTVEKFIEGKKGEPYEFKTFGETGLLYKEA